MEGALKKLLETPLKDVATQYMAGAIVIVNAKESVVNTCAILDGASVSSAVVYDFEKKAVLGMIDMLDIVSHLVETFPKEEDLKENLEKAIGISSFVFSTEAIKFIVNKSFTDVYVPLPRDCKLIHALDPLATGGLQRLPIVDIDGADPEVTWTTEQSQPLVKVLSQWAVINFLVEKRAELETPGSFFLEHLSAFKDNLLNDTPLIVDTKIRAIDAVKLIKATHRNAVVIVDDDNNPIRNFSANDLKVIRSSNIGDLLLPLLEFISKLSPHAPETHKPPRGVVGVSLDTTLIQAMSLIVENKIHRLWVFGPDGKSIVGVLSLTNILKEILKHL